MKLSPKKGGHGHVTSYTINIGSAEARLCGLVDDKGVSLEVEKLLLPNEKTIIIKLADALGVTLDELCRNAPAE